MVIDTIRLARRLVRGHLKRPFYIFMAVSQPLIYLVFFGAMFSRMPQANLSGISYFTYLTPGMTVMAALFGSAYLSAGTLADAERSLFDSIVISPVNRWSISMSYVVANLVPVLLQMLTVAICGSVIGGYPAGGLFGILLMLLIGLLTGIAFGCVSNVMGFLVQRAQNVLAVMNFVVMPLMFLSGMILATTSMPFWMQEFARFNPVHWAVVGAQAAYLGRWDSYAVYSVLTLASFAIAVAVAMHAAFLRYLLRR
jgi:ABC-2 type transport system permease protein